MEGLNFFGWSQSGGKGISGSGTENYIPKWTPDGFTLGDSQIFDDGTNVGINGTNPTFLIGTNTTSNSSLMLDGDNSIINLKYQGNIRQSFLVSTFGNTYNDIYSNHTVRLVNTAPFNNSDYRILMNSADALFISSQNANIGFGTITPTSKIHAKGIDSTFNNFVAKFDSSSGSVLHLRNDGVAFLNNSSSSESVFRVQNANTTLYSILTFSGGNVQSMFSACYEGSQVIAKHTEAIGLVQFNEQMRFVGKSGLTVGNSFSFDTLMNINVSSGNIGIGIGIANATSKLQVVGLPTYANNAAALAAGLTVGAFYIRAVHGLDIVV